MRPLYAIVVGLTLFGCKTEKKSFEESATLLNPLIKELNEGPASDLRAAPEMDSFAAARVNWEPCGRARRILAKMKGVKLDLETPGGRAAEQVRLVAADHEAHMDACIGGPILPGGKVLTCSPACSVALRDVAKEIQSFADEGRRRGVTVEPLQVP